MNPQITQMAQILENKLQVSRCRAFTQSVQPHAGHQRIQLCNLRNLRINPLYCGSNAWPR
jgi:hypothetical protein